MSPRTSETKIKHIREALLMLHKLLLTHVQREYEGKHGRVKSPGQLYALVTAHPLFAWLHSLSELVVSIDQIMDSKDTLERTNIKDLITYTKKLLRPGTVKNQFQKKYIQAIQKDPAVALAHSATIKFLNSK